jgi:TatD DNase family protein
MEMQLELARRLNLPVIIHSRDAPEETAEILGRYGGVRGVIHCFSYARAELKTFLDMGYFISFAGNLTYKNAAAIRDACVAVPGDRLLLETDCPYLAPVPFRGNPPIREWWRKTTNSRRNSEGQTLKASRNKSRQT